MSMVEPHIFFNGLKNSNLNFLVFQPSKSKLTTSKFHLNNNTKKRKNSISCYAFRKWEKIQFKFVPLDNLKIRPVKSVFPNFFRPVDPFALITAWRETLLGGALIT